MSAPQTRLINAVVTSAGLMQKTVKVRIGTQKWNKKVRKYFNHHTFLLVHDPRSSLRTGDIIEISPGWRISRHVRHVVNRIIAPFGEPVEARPAVLSEVERLEERRRKKEEKDRRRGKLGEVLEGEKAEAQKQTGTVTA